MKEKKAETLKPGICRVEANKMPIDYKKYPPDWKERRRRILKRAGNKCEFCGVENHAFGVRDSEGKFNKMEETCFIDGKIIQIVLTIAHLDHDETNWDVKDDRLAALCQQCHLRYDIQEKKRRRKSKKAVGDLFKTNLETK